MSGLCLSRPCTMALKSDGSLGHNKDAARKFVQRHEHCSGVCAVPNSASIFDRRIWRFRAKK